MNPFRRHRDTGDSPVESALRTSLARHAFETPDADDLTRRILSAATAAAAQDDSEHASATVVPLGSRSERGAWRTWGLPLVAAAAVIAVVGAGAAIASYDGGGNQDHQAASNVPSTVHTTVTATQTVPPSPKQTRTAIRQGTSGLTNVKIIDLTFYDQDEGFALASSQCQQYPGRTCTALLRTRDGQKWTSTNNGGELDVAGDTGGCPARRCVRHIRFATAAVGYAYGPDALFTTNDGGQTWQRRPGGAEAIETLDNNVIRVSATSGSCLPGCGYEVSTSAIGSDTWTPVPLPGGTPHGDGVQLSRGGSYAYLLVTQNPAGGSSDERSTLFRSSDDGVDWTDAGEPCPQSGGEVDSYQVAAGLGTDVAVLCRTRASGPFRVAVSTDAGATFTTQQGTIAYADVAATGYSDSGGALPGVLAGDPSTALAVAGRGVSISHNGGTSWHQAADLVGTFASIGFEGPKIGRAVSADGTMIWTTRNAGKTWTESTP